MCQLRCSTKHQPSRQLRSSDSESREDRDDPTGSGSVSEIANNPAPHVVEEQTVDVATHSFSLKQMCDEVAEQSEDLGAQSAQQLKMDAMPFDERKPFATTKEDLEQNTADVPVVMQRQVLVIQKAQRTVDVPLLQYIDTTVDDSARHHKKQHKDSMTKYNKIKMDKKLRSAWFRTENKKQIDFDSEGPSDLRFGVR